MLINVVINLSTESFVTTTTNQVDKAVTNFHDVICLVLHNHQIQSRPKLELSLLENVVHHLELQVAFDIDE